MKAIGIVTDSHSSITPEMAQRMGITVIPMPFFFGENAIMKTQV